MKQKYTENDEIELNLVHYAGPWYYLQWRYKKTHKFLWFDVHDQWKTLTYYKNNWINLCDDPRDEFYWDSPSFDLTRDSNAQEYEALKKRLKTKKDLWDYYSINHRTERYLQDLKAYADAKVELEERAKKYSK